MSELEGVQRLATRMIPGFQDKTYMERCTQTGLFTLEYRRLRGDLILLFRILCMKLHPELEHLFKLNSTSNTRGHAFKLEVLRTDNLPHVYRFSRRVVNTWNNLPTDVVTAPSVVAFKARLDNDLWHLRADATKGRVASVGYPTSLQNA